MSVNSFARHLADAVNSIKQKGGSVQRGVIQGNGIVVNGQTYPYDAAIDAQLRTGEDAWVSMNDSGTRAVVVGK